jgi:hypothetical protein
MKFCNDAPASHVNGNPANNVPSDATTRTSSPSDFKDDEDWIDMIEQECGSSPSEAKYVNLLQNPERFTGRDRTILECYCFCKYSLHLLIIRLFWALC